MRSAIVILIIILSVFSAIAQNNLDLDLTTAFDSTEKGKQKLARKLERKNKRDLRREKNRDTTAILNDSVRFNNSLVFNFVDNPAYTGQEAKNQINGEYVYSPYYNQETFSYNIRFTSIFEKERKRLKGKRAKGLGLYLQTEQQFAYKQARTGFSFSRHFNIKNKVIISLGTSMEYIENKVDFSKLTFGDQISQPNGFLYATKEQANNSQSSNFNTNIGISLRTHKFYSGFFIQNTTTPNESVTQGVSPLRTVFGFNISRIFKVSPNIKFKPEFFILKNGSIKTKALIGHFIYKEKILAGLGTKSNSILHSEFGYLYKHFRILVTAQIRFSKSVYESNEINNFKINIRYRF